MEVNTKLKITSKQFFINEEKGIVTCKITFDKQFCSCCNWVIIGQAKLFEGDVWDVEVGKMIAERKAIIKGLKCMINEINKEKRRLSGEFYALIDAEEILEDKFINAKIDLMHRTGAFERIKFIESGELWSMFNNMEVPFPESKE